MSDSGNILVTDGGPFEYENEGMVVENPRFVCEECGFANVRMIEAAKPAAKCTNCGAGYIESEAFK